MIKSSITFLLPKIDSSFAYRWSCKFQFERKDGEKTLRLIRFWLSSIFGRGYSLYSVQCNSNLEVISNFGWH